MKMKIRNYTPHEVVLKGVKYPSEGCARCETEVKKIAEIDGIPVNRREFKAVYGLPDSEPGTIYIVSAIVAQAIAGQRDDCFVVDETIRDEAGRIIGCKALAKIG